MVYKWDYCSQSMLELVQLSVVPVVDCRLCNPVECCVSYHIRDTLNILMSADNITYAITSPPHTKTNTCHVSCVRCHMSWVHMSCVMCKLSGVLSHVSFSCVMWCVSPVTSHMSLMPTATATDPPPPNCPNIHPFWCKLANSQTTLLSVFFCDKSFCNWSFVLGHL